MTPPAEGVERTEDSADFFDYADRGVLLLRRCDACGEVRGPQEAWCVSCRAEEHTVVEAGGGGSLVSWAVVHRAPLPWLETPYVAAVVEVDEGPWLLVRLATSGDPLEVGTRLHLEVDRVPGSEPLLVARTS
ncbi:hypothetical protein GCM10027270_33560 [Nocardioides ginkgobilobae]